MKKAAGLKYEKGDRAPKIIALGQGQIAEKIIEAALDHQIPIVKNIPLSNQLLKHSINEEIPPELYLAVAEILAFIYHNAGEIP